MIGIRNGIGLHSGIRRIVMFVVLGLAGHATTWGQADTISLAQVPKPPEAIAELLRRTEIQFVYGARRQPAAMRLANGRLPDAMTDYQLTYNFGTRDRVVQGGGKKHKSTTIRAGTAKLRSKHVVWFREQPPLETFWSDRLVLHELDHVRISSDPRLQRRFRELLAESSRQSLTTDADVERVFQQIRSLVEIRYQELDRVTKHGTLDLPDDSPLKETLAP